MTSVAVPRQLQELFGAAPREAVTTTSVAGAITALDARYPGIAERILEPDGRPRRYVNLFVNNRLVGDDGDMGMPLDDGDVLWIIPSVAGG